MTHYAEDLLGTIENLTNWPDRVKLMQNNWIGKSLGANINFKIIEKMKKLKFLQQDLILYLVHHLLLSHLLILSH